MVPPDLVTPNSSLTVPRLLFCQVARHHRQVRINQHPLLLCLQVLLSVMNRHLKNRLMDRLCQRPQQDLQYLVLLLALLSMQIVLITNQTVAKGLPVHKLIWQAMTNDVYPHVMHLNQPPPSLLGIHFRLHLPLLHPPHPSLRTFPCLLLLLRDVVL